MLKENFRVLELQYLWPEKMLEIHMKNGEDQGRKFLKMEDTAGGHYGIVLETRNNKEGDLPLGEEDVGILFMEDKKGELCSFNAVKKVHELNRHKGKEQLLQGYRNAEWMSPEIVNTIERVVNDCKACQKFQKSVARPRVTLPKASSFNEVVTLDLKEFGNKYVLWMIDSFSRFMVGKMISNKKADTIIQAIIDSWCIIVGFPSHGFFADNGGEFSNIKLDELTSKLGLTVKFGPTYSPWSNGLNERNHALADLTIKKLLEENKTALNDSLVKAAAWTHKISVNKHGYTPLQLVTGKAVTLLGLTTGYTATESLTDREAVQRTMESLAKTTHEFP